MNMLAFFARHEIRLVWRDFVAMATAGRKRQRYAIIIALIVFTLFMHGLANMMIGRFAIEPHEFDKPAFVIITGCIALAWSLMLSQAMESVTRAFYARADFDLILASPTSIRFLFAIRMVAVAIASVFLTTLLASAFVNVLALRNGVQWLGSYGVAAALGANATAFALISATVLVHVIGPARTRFVSQVLSAVLGAALVIGIQVIAIMLYGTLSRLDALRSKLVIESLPDDLYHVIWWPARAAMGAGSALAFFLLFSFLFLGTTIFFVSRRFAAHDVWAVRAVPVLEQPAPVRPFQGFKRRSAFASLCAKEWMLLLRDPWLLSQTLMQILYLLPPALLIWRDFGDQTGIAMVITPVLVVAAGQLAGGLAWLAISGEDAADLIATAPILEKDMIRAKIVSVLVVIGSIFAPFILVMTWMSFWTAGVTAIGILVSAAAATAIQMWFRAQARRTHFRYRHTSSRLATFAEVFSSMAWAGTTTFIALKSPVTLAPALIGVMVLVIARLFRPR